MLHKISGRDLQYQFPIAKIFIHSLFSLNIEVLQMFPSYFEADRIFIGPSIFIKYVFTSLSMSWLTLVSWYLNSSISCLFMEDIEFKTFYEGYIIPKKCQMNAYIVNNFQEVGSLVISIKFSIWNVRKTVSRIPVSSCLAEEAWCVPVIAYQICSCSCWHTRLKHQTDTPDCWHSWLTHQTDTPDCWHTRLTHQTVDTPDWHTRLRSPASSVL